MKASIIIVAWNGIDYLGPCLDSVLKQDPPDFEVIVVDNGSTDGSADFVAEHYPQVQLIRNSQNLGFAGGNNIGLRAASGDTLILLNQDTVVHENWLTALLASLDDPTVGMAGCKMLYPDGRIQHAGAYIVDARGTPGHIGRYEDDAGQYNEPRDLECVTAAGVALRRSTLARVGPLDEGFYPAYFEDTDWCYRVREAGLRVVYWPDAVLTHYESTSIKEIGYAEKVVYHHGRLRFLFKHKPLDWLQDTFYPAESSWAESLGRTVEMMAARDAYLRLWLTLPDIFEFRCRLGDSLSVGLDPEKEWAGLVKLVTDLRALCARPLQVAGEDVPALDTSVRDLLSPVQTLWQVEEQPFKSDAPVIGGGIVAFREAWNNVSTRWYVLPLLQQQVQFNSAVAEYVTEFSNRVTDFSEQLTRKIEEQQRDIAQNMRELNTLAATLNKLQRDIQALTDKNGISE